jgi:hypothetical protein
VFEWEPIQSDSEADDEDDPDNETLAESDPKLAAEMFVDFALSLFFEGKLSAKSLCVLCFGASSLVLNMMSSSSSL